MFHYQKDIDAWRRHTIRLSPAEKGAYSELLDELYSTEQPLPDDIDELCRVAGASKPDERKAVEKVLHRFFRLTPGGYVQDRVLEELDQYRDYLDKCKTNGKKGGRPPKRQNQDKTQNKPLGYFSVPENTTFQNPEETHGLFLGSENTPKNTTFQNPEETKSVKPLNHSISVVNSYDVGVVISPNSDPPPTATGKANHRVPLPDDWRPCNDTCRALQTLHGIPIEFIDQQTAEFRIFWRDRGGEASSWNATFLKRCVAEWKRFKSQADPYRPGNEDAQSFIERVADRSWAEGLE